MWIYEKKLLYPVKVSGPNPYIARFLLEQYGGADGALAQSICYLNQRFTMPTRVISLINTIATEELAHLEIIGTMIYQLTNDSNPNELAAGGLAPNYIKNENALAYMDSSGNYFQVQEIRSKGDPIADLFSNIAMEERSRATLQRIIHMSDDSLLNDGLRFLREREIIHSLRFHEAIEILKEEQLRKNYY